MQRSAPRELAPQASDLEWTILAQDPSVVVRDRMLRARVVLPYERLGPGPVGHRVHVVDYDASAAVQYAPGPPGADPFARRADAALLADPEFHRRNAFAIVMRTLASFERALGRRVEWGCGGHQIYVVPHAFCDANAFYSRADHALLFGYFPGRREGTVYSCLSHDVLAHEASHALLDGLRERFMDPSSPDQAAFHEGFADVVALLSVFSLRDVVGKILDLAGARARPAVPAEELCAVLPRRVLDFESLSRSGLLGLAEQMGRELALARGGALRRSVALEPSRRLYRDAPEFREPHRRGELLVAPILRAFVEAWCGRIRSLGEVRPGYVDRARVVEDGADLAAALLSMVIRALDYCPPVDVEFPDYLSALLTADRELVLDDGRWRLRERLRRSFARFGIAPASDPEGEGCWKRANGDRLRYHRTHFEPMQRDPQELFRFVWENRDELHFDPAAYTQVLSVRPCMRTAPDGFVLRETVAEVHQTIDLEADELKVRGIAVPPDMPPQQSLTLYGGSTLIFDEYGRLKYEIHKRIDAPARQQRRLLHLWNARPPATGTATAIGRVTDEARLHRLHRQRAAPSFLERPRKELL